VDEICSNWTHSLNAKRRTKVHGTAGFRLPENLRAVP
jgi:hypothetical protein